MATIELATPMANRRGWRWIALGLILALAVGWLIVSLTRPPQMGADDEVFRTVDALFTAVTARDDRLVGQCVERLRLLKAAGKLPVAAADYLDGIVKKAAAQRWQPAAEKLYAFMSAQRREGAEQQPANKKDRGSRNLVRK